MNLENKMSDLFEQAYKAGFQDGRNGTPCELTELLNNIEALETDIKVALDYLENAYSENWGYCVSNSIRVLKGG